MSSRRRAGRRKHGRLSLSQFTQKSPVKRKVSPPRVSTPEPHSQNDRFSYPEWNHPSNTDTPTKMKSKKDLADFRSYYVDGVRRDENGVRYQVVWRDGVGNGRGSESSSDDDVPQHKLDLLFEDFDHEKYWSDKIPPSCMIEAQACDDANKSINNTAEASCGSDTDDDIEVLAEVKNKGKSESGHLKSRKRTTWSRWMKMDLAMEKAYKALKSFDDPEIKIIEPTLTLPDVIDLTEDDSS